MVRIPANGADEPLLKAMTEKANYMATIDSAVDPVVEAEEGGRSEQQQQQQQQQHHRSRSRSPRDRDSNGRRTRFDSVDDGTTTGLAISSSLTDHSHFDAHKGYRSEGGGSPDPSRRHVSFLLLCIDATSEHMLFDSDSITYSMQL